MANNNYKTKKKSKFNVAGIIALILAAAVTVTALGVGTSGFTDWSFSRFFPKSEEAEPKPDENEQADNTVITVDEERGLKLMSATISPENYAEYGISTLAESAYSLTATITPSYTTFKEVDYSAKWANASSEWASGKDVTDYVSVTQTVDGALTVNVEVLQPFSEQVIIDVTLRRNTSINASCTVDYVATYDIELLNNRTVMTNLSDSFVIELNNVVGTLAFETEDLLDITFYVPNDVYNGLQDRGVEVNDDNWHMTVTPNDQGTGFLGGYTTGPFYTIKSLLQKYYEQQVTGIEFDEFFTILSDVYLDGRAPASCSGEEVIQIEIYTQRKYNGQSYGNVDLDNTSITLTDWSDFEVSATGMNLSQSSIIAG